MTILTKYVLYDISRNKFIFIYTALLLIVSISIFHLDDNASKSLLSLLSIVLFTVPLISLIFSTIHYYNSLEFIELLLAQPMSRNSILKSEFWGIVLSLIGSFLIGVGLPILLYSANWAGISLLFYGIALTIIFSSLAFWVSVKSKDKARGIGFVLMLWFYFSVIYDGLILLVVFTFSDYPIEKLVLFLSMLNPIDLGRVGIMLQMDASALMGFTGALFKTFFTNNTSVYITAIVLLLWMILPQWRTQYLFNRKDL